MIQVTFPFAQFTDKAGQPLDAGFIYIGTENQNPETNPIALFYDDALTVPAAQPLRTINGYIARNGSPGRVYTNTSAYSITVRDKSSNLVATALDASALDNIREELAAPSGSSLVGANAYQTQDDVNKERVSVTQFLGADRTGATSSVGAVNAAIAYINTLSGSAVLHFPPGLYDLKAGVTQKITKDHVSIVGENAFINAESGNIFYFDNTVQMRRGAIKGFTFQYTFPTVSTVAVPIVCSKVLYMRLKEIRVLNAPAVLYLSECSNVVIDDVTGTTVNIAANALHFNSCSVVDVDNVSLITNAGLQPINPATAYPNPPVAGNVFIRITGAVNDTYRFKSGVLCNRFYRGLHSTTTAGQVLLNTALVNCVFDYCYDKGIFVENTGGSISNMAITDPYIQAMSGNGIHFATTAGLTNEVQIVRPVIYMSGYYGIFISSTAIILNYNFSIDSPRIYGSGRVAGTGYDIYATYSRVRVRGGRVGINSLSFTGYSAQGQYGIYFDGCDQYSVSDVELGGSSGSNLFSNNPATNYKARSVRDNRPAISHVPADTLAYMTTDLVAVVSGDAYTNNTPFREYVSIYATGASGAATIEVNTVQYSVKSEWSGILYPGDTLKVTTAIACNRRKARMP